MVPSVLLVALNACSKSTPGVSGGGETPPPSTAVAKKPSKPATNANAKRSDKIDVKSKIEPKVDPIVEFEETLKKVGLWLTFPDEFLDKANARMYAITPSARSTDLSKIPNPPFPFGLHLEGVTIRDADLAHLKGLGNLRFLSLKQQKGVTDDGLIHLKDLHGLQELFLDGTSITDAGLKTIGSITSLRRLIINDNEKITDAGMACLEGLINLEYLSIWGTKITDVGIVHLKDMKKLKLLYAQVVSDEQVRLLAKYGIPHALRHAQKADQKTRPENPAEVAILELHGEHITDASLEHVKLFPNLVELDLSTARITDAGLRHLYGLKKLKKLSVQITGATPDGVKQLRAALPNSTIAYE